VFAWVIGQIDITGQVVSDSIGTRVYSGVGGQVSLPRQTVAYGKWMTDNWLTSCCAGQVDFLRGASLNHPNGRPILAMPSRTHKGIARYETDRHHLPLLLSS
jgi:4-hydroxybutyrate CoA-transferase